MKQESLINQLNKYLQYHSRPMQMTSGYCHGLTLLWLYMMDIGQQGWFYDTVRSIGGANDASSFDKIEPDIEKFISYIEWLQHSNKYCFSINQFDLEKLTESNNPVSFSFLLHHTEIETVLDALVHENKPVSVSGPDHTVGVYKRSGLIYLFDTNHNMLEPVRLNDTQSLKLQLIKSLFRCHYYPEWRLPFEIQVQAGSAQIKNTDCVLDKEVISNLYDSLIRDGKSVDVTGYDQITNLHLACETGDESLVAKLLQHGANPNKASKDDWTPMLVASANGYASIVTLLMKFGALANMPNKQGMKPADIAREHGHSEIVKLLS